jgi:GNAT superfamily N-acetyltransferase
MLSDLDDIINIRNQASKRLKEDGVDQWQGIEPSRETFIKDIENKEAYVMIDQDKIIGIASLCLSNEEAYQDLVDLKIKAVTIHRIAVHHDYLLKGLSKHWFEFFENQAKNLKRTRIYIDTHPNNFKMLSLFKKYQYTYIGQFEFKHLPSPLRQLFMKTILS